MRLGATGPTVVAMDDARLLRLAAVAAVAGALAQVVAGVLEPDLGETILARRFASSPTAGSGPPASCSISSASFLMVAAFTVVGHTLAEGPGRQWARVGQPFLVLMGALGAGAIVAGPK